MERLGQGIGQQIVVEKRVQVLFQSAREVAELARVGRARALAVTVTDRVPAFPEVPILREAGVDIVSNGWFGIVVNANTPEPILERLHRETIALIADPELAARLSAAGSMPRASASSADFARFVTEEAARWRPMVQAPGASGD